MSILHLDIPGARVLDLFAGSGALGLECLSRGAATVDLVEKDPRTLAVLRRNIETLGAAADVTIHRKDAFGFAESLGEGTYDLVVADPPYTGGHAERLVALWLKRPFSSILSVEHDSRTPLPTGASDTRRYGASAITFYRTGE